MPPMVGGVAGALRLVKRSTRLSATKFLCPWLFFKIFVTNGGIQGSKNYMLRNFSLTITKLFV